MIYDLTMTLFPFFVMFFFQGIETIETWIESRDSHLKEVQKLQEQFTESVLTYQKEYENMRNYFSELGGKNV